MALGLSHLLTDPHWRDIPRFPDQERRSELWELMLAKVGERTLAEWQQVLDGNPNLSAELFRCGTEVLHHPQLVHEGQVVVVEDPERGPVRGPSTLVQTAGQPLTAARPAPVLDADAGRLPDHVAQAEAPASVPEPGLPLAGITIVEFGLMFAAPFGSTILTDLGARVIKVESLTGDTIRHVLPFPESGCARVMQGKESICLDLTAAEGRGIVHDLVRRAEVVLQSFRAGAAARAGVDSATLCALNPDLVYVNAPGYGIDGPYGRRPAYAPSIGAAGGFALCDAPGAMAATATMDEIKQASRQLNQAGAIPSLQADGVSALGVGSAILVGLLGRARGRAQDALTVTMLGTSTHAMVDHVVDWTGRPPSPRVDDGIHGLSALYRLYPTAEGWIFLAAPRDRDWAALAAGLGIDDLRFADAESRARHEAELAAVLEARFAEAPAPEWERRLLAAGVGCVEATGSTAGLMIQQDPELLAEFGAESESPVFGEYVRQAPPIRFSRSTTRAPGGCLAGEHTDAVLAEIGRDAAAIADLRARGIVA